MGLFRVDRERTTSAHRGMRQLDAKIGQVCLMIREAAWGEGGSSEQLDVVESQLLPQCQALARGLVAHGEGRRVRRLLHSRRKLASLVARGDVGLLWRYVAFIDAIRDKAQERSGSPATIDE